MVGVQSADLYGGKRAEWGRCGMRFKVYIGDDCIGFFSDYDHVLGFINTLGSPEVTIEDTRTQGARLLVLT
ncbi:MAG: hypothetical protein P8J01_04905 [Acidimicrobiales bacterium]|nr:hypothetical protein [Acidimicrobiales bacterium]